MTCREFADFMADYLSGELRAAVRKTFDQHLAVCPTCVTYLADYAATIRAGHSAFTTQDSNVPASVPQALIYAILAARPR